MIIRSKAPLRLGFAGGGTDVSPYSDDYGGLVLNATVDMYAYCTIEETTTDTIEFVAADRGESYNASSSSYIDPEGDLVLHKGIYNRIVRDFNGGVPLSFRLTTYSDAPAGSGLGSSSTMVVAILKAFQEWLNLPLGDYDLAHLAYEIERKDLGLSGGKQDQYAATFGGVNFIEFYSGERVVVNPLRVKNWIMNELENSLVLFYTGTSRDSAKIIDEQVRNTIARQETSLEAMHTLKRDAVFMKELLLKGDIQGFGYRLGNSWRAKKEMASSISNSMIDAVYDRALQLGAISGKVSGAGGGGFMMFIVDPVKRMDVIEGLREFDGRVMNAHFSKGGCQAWTLHDKVRGYSGGELYQVSNSNIHIG